MTTPNSRDPKMDENTARFRTILNSTEEDAPKPAKASRSVMDLLPHAAKRSDPAPQPAPASRPVATPRSSRRPSVARLPEAPVIAPAAASPAAQESEPASASRRFKFGPAFWTITGTLSLIVNLVLIVIVAVLLVVVARLNLKVSQLMALASLPEETVRGLYENFVKMDDAHIRTTIFVNDEIPVQFNLDINTQTEVELSRDTPINGARVTLTTGGLNITNAPANIVLPAGTRLPINLILTVPVDKRVPVNLVVPVDIALNQTDLHDPFEGLRLVVEPLYCLFDQTLVSPDGTLTCEQKTP